MQFEICNVKKIHPLRHALFIPVQILITFFKPSFPGALPGLLDWYLEYSYKMLQYLLFKLWYHFIPFLRLCACK